MRRAFENCEEPDGSWKKFRLVKIKFILLVAFLIGALSGLRQFLASGSPLKIMKNAFYSTSKSLFVLKIFKLLS